MKRLIGKIDYLKPTLNSKFIVIQSIVFIIVFVLTAALTYQLHLKISEHAISQQFRQRVNQFAHTMDLRLGDLYRVSDQIVLNESVIAFLKASNRGDVRHSAEYAGMMKVLNENLISVSNGIAIYLSDLNGQISMASSSILPYEFGAAALEQASGLLAESDGELVWLRGTTLEYKPNYGQPGSVIIAARRIKGVDALTHGTLMLILDESVLTNDLRNGIDDYDGIIYLLDKHGSLLFTDEAVPNQIPLERLRAVDSSEIQQLGKTHYLIARAQVSASAFQIFGSISMEDIRKQSDIIRKVSIASLLISVLVSGLLIMLTSQRLLRPIKELVRGMRAVENGNLKARIRIDTKDELAFIGERFNAMLGNIERLIQEGYEKQLREREAELSMLQARLNPHFLYNSLDLIHSKLYMKDDRENAELVIQLSDLLRYALESATEETTLEDELNHVQNYLLLQQARAEGELDIVIDVEEEVRHCPIIRLLLQPLVENSFIHGFRHQVGIKRLTIRAYRQAEYLIVEIGDNGCGFSIESFLARAGRGREGGNGIGLSHVKRRIELAYGEPYRLEMDSDPARGTTMTLYLPFGDE